MNNTISREKLMTAYDGISKAMERIESLMEPGGERATAWLELLDARALLREALVDGTDIQIREAA